MKFWKIAMALALVSPTASLACDQLIEKHRVETPDHKQQVLWPETGYFGCTKEQTAMFQKNYNAIERAELPKSIDELTGTWLGDDVIAPLLGLVVYGQEVLEIKKGTQEGTILVEQYWYQSVFDEVDNVSIVRWVRAGGYSGIVRKITLKASFDDEGAPTSWKALEQKRSRMRLSRKPDFDIILNEYIDRFAKRSTISLENSSSLVITPQVQSKEPFDVQSATFSRVSDGSPSLAILLVSQFSRRMLNDFECFVHQISEGAGELPDTLSPISSQEAGTIVENVLLAEKNAAELSSKYFALKSEDLESNEQQLFQVKEELSKAYKLAAKLASDPIYQRLQVIMESSSELGCTSD